MAAANGGDATTVGTRRYLIGGNRLHAKRSTDTILRQQRDMAGALPQDITQRTGKTGVKSEVASQLHQRAIFAAAERCNSFE